MTTVSAISPTCGDIRGGTLLTIHGSGFDSIGGAALDPRCRFGDASVPVDTIEAELAICTAPAGAQGTVRVQLSLDGAQFAGGEVRYTYFRQPLLLSLRPSGGPAAGGTHLTLEGRGFSPFAQATQTTRTEIRPVRTMGVASYVVRLLGAMFPWLGVTLRLTD